MEFFGKTDIDFLGKRKTFFYVSSAINVIGILILILSLFNVKVGSEDLVRLGIDFQGGTQVNIRTTSPQPTEAVRAAMDKAGIANAEIKSYGTGISNEYQIRVSKDVKGNATEAVRTAMVAAFPNENATVLQSDVIEAKISGELRLKAFWAIILAIIAILIYIAFRFEFIYGVGAIIALVHDVCVAFTLVVLVQKFNILNLEFNQGILAALLTVVGFSINDTVIIFDRIRENREKHKNISIIRLMNLSINETLSRTINTVLTVVLVLLTILILGGEALHGFSFTMLVGIITGTYSSIYIASSFVVWYLENVKHQDLESKYREEIAAASAKA
ncbi:MAG: protein translocase subunit SecF [Candidatus Kapabacteria bacterium]|nr:protein translocase subunit SecF [Candidatus Kapabacteria bacterium]